MSAAPKLGFKYHDLIDKKWSKKVGLIDANAGVGSSFDPKFDIAVCSGKEPDALLDLALSHGACQIVQEGTVAFETELNTSALMLTNKDKFLKFPVSSILCPTDVGRTKEKEFMQISIDFAKASEKQEVLLSVQDQLGTVSKSQSFISEVLGVADELVTNAVFNAPFVDKENSGSGVSRTDQEVAMEKGKTGRVFLGSDEDRLIVGCFDPYGSLNIENLFRRVRDCYVKGVADNINMGSGGAGIGSFMVYNSSTSYYAAVKGGCATLICCVIPLKMSGRKRAMVPKNLHFFQL